MTHRPLDPCLAPPGPAAAGTRTVKEAGREQALQQELIRLVGLLLGEDPAAIPLDASARACGLNSLNAARLLHQLEALLGRELPRGCVLTAPDLRALARQLHEDAPARAQPGDASLRR